MCFRLLKTFSCFSFFSKKIFCLVFVTYSLSYTSFSQKLLSFSNHQAHFHFWQLISPFISQNKQGERDIFNNQTSPSNLYLIHFLPKRFVWLQRSTNHKGRSNIRISMILKSLAFLHFPCHLSSLEIPECIHSCKKILGPVLIKNGGNPETNFQTSKANTLTTSLSCILPNPTSTTPHYPRFF